MGRKFEESRSIVSRCLAHHVDWFIAQFRDEFTDETHECWLIGLAAMRDWCKEWAIGLDVESLQRNETNRVTQGLSVLERDHARDRDIASERETALSLVGIPCEAVNHGSRRNAFAPQDVKKIVKGVAGVDDQGQIEFLSQVNLGRECLSLGAARRMLVVVIQSALTNPYQSRVSSPSHLEHRFDVMQRVVRVEPDSREDFHTIVKFGDGESLTRSLSVGADDDDSIHLGIKGAGEVLSHIRHDLLVLGEISILQMAMRVGPECHESLLIRGKSGSPFSTGPPG